MSLANLVKKKNVGGWDKMGFVKKVKSKKGSEAELVIPPVRCDIHLVDPRKEKPAIMGHIISRNGMITQTFHELKELVMETFELEEVDDDEQTITVNLARPDDYDKDKLVPILENEDLEHSIAIWQAAIKLRKKVIRNQIISQAVEVCLAPLTKDGYGEKELMAHKLWEMALWWEAHFALDSRKGVIAILDQIKVEEGITFSKFPVVYKCTLAAALWALCFRPNESRAKKALTKENVVDTVFDVLINLQSINFSDRREATKSMDILTALQGLCAGALACLVHVKERQERCCQRLNELCSIVRKLSLDMMLLGPEEDPKAVQNLWPILRRDIQENLVGAILNVALNNDNVLLRWLDNDLRLNHAYDKEKLAEKLEQEEIEKAAASGKSSKRSSKKKKKKKSSRRKNIKIFSEWSLTSICSLVVPSTSIQTRLCVASAIASFARHKLGRKVLTGCTLNHVKQIGHWALEWLSIQISNSPVSPNDMHTNRSGYSGGRGRRHSSSIGSESDFSVLNSPSSPQRRLSISSVASVESIESPFPYDQVEKIGSDEDIPDVYKILEFNSMSIWGWATLSVENVTQDARSAAEKKVQQALSEGGKDSSIADIKKRAVNTGIESGIPELLISLSRIGGSDIDKYRNAHDNLDSLKLIDACASGAISTASIIGELANKLLTSGVVDILLRLLFSAQLDCRQCAGCALQTLASSEEDGCLDLMRKGGLESMLDVLDPRDSNMDLPTSCDLQSSCASTLMKMSFKIFTELPELRVDQTVRAFTVAVEKAKVNKQSKNLRSFLGCALWRFCYNSANCEKIGELGGIQPITMCAFEITSRIMSDSIESLEEIDICLLEYMVSALWLLSYNDYNAELMRDSSSDEKPNAILTLVKVISLKHSKRLNYLHENAGKALWVLCLRQANARLAVRCGLTDAVRSFPPEKMVLASGLLLVLIEDKSNLDTIREKQGEYFLEHLFVSMVKCDRDTLQSYGATCLARMAMTAKGRFRIHENDGVDALLSLVNRTTVPNTQTHVLQGILNLSVSEKLQDYICKHGLYNLLEVAWAPTCQEARMVVAGILENLKNNASNRSRLYRAELHVKAVIEQSGKGLLNDESFSGIPRSPLWLKTKKKKVKRGSTNVKDKFLEWLDDEISTKPSRLSSGGSSLRMNQSMHQSLPQLKIGKGDHPTFDYIPNFSTASKSEVLVSYELTDADDEEHLFALPKLSQKMRNSMKMIYLRGLNESEKAVDIHAANAFWHRGPKNVEFLKPSQRKITDEIRTSRGMHSWQLQSPAYYWRSYRQDVDSFGVQMITTHQVLLDNDPMPAPPVLDDNTLNILFPDPPSMPGLPENGKPLQYVLPPPAPAIPHKHTILHDDHPCTCLIQHGDKLNSGWDPAPIMGGTRFEYSALDGGPCGMFGISRDHHVKYTCQVNVEEKVVEVEEVIEDWIFKPRLETSDAKAYFDVDLFDAMCDTDWNRVTDQKHFRKWLFAEKICNIPEENEADRKKVLDTIGELFKTNYKHIMYTFEFYSAMGNSSDLSQMLFNQCMDMLGDMDIPEDNKYINKGALDRLFVEANVEGEEQQDNDVGDANADRALMRFELLELFVRISVAKFMTTKRISGEFNGILESVKTVVHDHVLPNTGEGSCNAALHDIDEWRREHLYNKETDQVLREHRKIIKAIFDKYKGDEMRRLKQDKMHIKSYMIMLRDIKFFNEDFTMREARLAFVWAKTKVIDEVASNEGSFYLNFEDFMECLCRIAVLKGAPPEEDLRMMFEKKIIKAPDIKAWHGVSVRPQQSKLIDRESGEWGQPWTRTMAQKLQDFMNLLISVFDVDGDGIDEADLEYLEVRRI